MDRITTFKLSLLMLFCFLMSSNLMAASSVLPGNAPKTTPLSWQEKSLPVDETPKKKYHRIKKTGTSPATTKILKRYWTLTFPLGRSQYNKAKAIIEDAKKIYKDSCDLDKVNLRYVRFSLNLLLACENIRKDTWLSRKVANYYIAVALKDLTIGAKIFYSNRKGFHMVWKNVICDYTEIATVYSEELVKAAEKVKYALAKIKEVLLEKDKK